jgi:predicted pyridoxine 5'-phosphate oxidase superfamily flavin-nucleotide-binding protein
VAAYHAGMRELQDRFDTRRLADRLDEKLARTAFTAEDRAFIETRPLFFLATADAEGRPDCSYKGGAPGFVRVTGAAELAFPSYDGNGMFRSLGNVLVNPGVGLLFLDFERPRRLRVLGTAAVHADDPLVGDFEGAQLVVRVRAQRIFPNCPRYIHGMRMVETSVYVPRPGYEPPVAAWKASFKDVLARG